MQLDAGSATHPIVRPINSIEAVSQAFDAIAYSKGEAVIRMIEDAVGETAFRDGIRSYMRKHAYANTITDDLWRELEAASGKPITAIAHDFTLQPGVPLVTIEAAECSAGTTKLTLTQSRFETDARAAEQVAWRIPIRARSIDGGGEASLIMEKDAPASLSIPGCAPVVVNAGQSGYFRTLYPPSPGSRACARHLPRCRRSTSSGCSTTHSALGSAGIVPATSYLDFARYVPADSDPLIWSLVARKLAAIDRVFDGSPEQADWRKLARERIEPQFERGGLDGKARPEGRSGDPAREPDRLARRPGRRTGNRRGDRALRARCVRPEGTASRDPRAGARRDGAARQRGHVGADARARAQGNESGRETADLCAARSSTRSRPGATCARSRTRRRTARHDLAGHHRESRRAASGTGLRFHAGERAEGAGAGRGIVTLQLHSAAGALIGRSSAGRRGCASTCCVRSRRAAARMPSRRSPRSCAGPGVFRTTGPSTRHG